MMGNYTYSYFTPFKVLTTLLTKSRDPPSNRIKTNQDSQTCVIQAMMTHEDNERQNSEMETSRDKDKQNKIIGDKT